MTTSIPWKPKHLFNVILAVNTKSLFSSSFILTSYTWHKLFTESYFPLLTYVYICCSFGKFKVKELLNKKKLETLVDSKLQGYYIVEEVEELIQVALLCTLNTASDRPKMSDVVKMLEGDGLAERWEQWKKEDIICGELNHCNFSSNNWIINDSTPGLHPEELSGPR